MDTSFVLLLLTLNWNKPTEEKNLNVLKVSDRGKWFLLRIKFFKSLSFRKKIVKEKVPKNIFNFDFAESPSSLLSQHLLVQRQQ